MEQKPILDLVNVRKVYPSRRGSGEVVAVAGANISVYPEEIVSIDLEGRADYADVMVVASGRSARHVASIADHLAERVKADGFGRAIVEGEKTGDWAIVDCGDVVVHVFRPEVRAFYDLEAMWSAVAEQRAQG